jgi:hypothetical protein
MLPCTGVKSALPHCREEIQLLFAQIATGMGRDPVLNAEFAMHPASAAAERAARTLKLGDEDAGPRGESMFSHFSDVHYP